VSPDHLSLTSTQVLPRPSMLTRRLITCQVRCVRARTCGARLAQPRPGTLLGRRVEAGSPRQLAKVDCGAFLMQSTASIHPKSAQQIFDATAEHLFRQNEPSADAISCRFRLPNGNCCAVGVWIPPDRYLPHWEGSGGIIVMRYNLEFCAALEASGVYLTDPVIFELMYSLQKVHDRAFPPFKGFPVPQCHNRLDYLNVALASTANKLGVRFTPRQNLPA
jgi:hypothetical protein